MSGRWGKPHVNFSSFLDIDSVYNVEWSEADPWLFASLSYDGRLVINHVPREEKFKIMMLPA